MKIGCFLPNKPNKKLGSGAAVSTRTLIEGMRKKGHQVIGFCPPSEEIAKVPEMGAISVAASLIIHKYRAKKCDILFATNSTGLAYLDQQRPLVNVFRSTASGIFKIISQNPQNLEEGEIWQKHSQEIENINFKSGPSQVRAQENTALVENYIAQNSSYLVAISENIKAEMISFFHLPASRIQVIENGIISQWFRKRNCSLCQGKTKKWLESKKPVLLWLTRIGSDEVNFKIKGLDRILEVMNRIDNVHKVIISFVSQPEPYEKLFSPYGIEFISNWPYEHLPHLVREADIFLQSSRYEGFGLTLIEAMASGLACVSFPTGIGSKIIETGKNGFLVSSTDEMIEKVAYLAKRPTKRQEFGQRASLLVGRHYRIERMLDQYLKLFKKIKKTS